MRLYVLAALAAGTVLAFGAPAEAAQGCGIGYHRTYHGHCVPNGPVIVVHPVIGAFYPGHGYWYGGRYWWHRYAWHGGWRYR